MVVAFLLLLLGAAYAQTGSINCTSFCGMFDMVCGSKSMTYWASASPPPTANIFDIYNSTTDCWNECMEYVSDPNCLDGASAALCSTGNTFGCRQYHLDVANTSYANAMVHCPHTTPLSSATTDITATSAISGTVCASPTDFAPSGSSQNGLLADFCNNAVGVCGAYVQGLTAPRCISIYRSVGGTTNVTVYPGAGGRKFPLGSAGLASDTTLPCRRYHVSVARTSAANAAIHCPHAIFGEDVCGSDCQTYCAGIMGICTGSNSQYNGTNALTDCMTACGNFKKSSNYTQFTGNTVQCRLYHMSVASDSAANAVVHCPHAGPTGGGVCVQSAAAGTTASFVVVAALAFLAKFFM